MNLDINLFIGRVKIKYWFYNDDLIQILEIDIKLKIDKTTSKSVMKKLEAFFEFRNDDPAIEYASYTDDSYVNSFSFIWERNRTVICR